MPNQEESRDGMPRKDKGRPSPDTGNDERGTERPRAGEQKGLARDSGSPAGQDDRGDGPGKMAVTSDQQPDLVSPSGVNERDHGSADDKPMGGGSLDFDDGTDMVHPRGKVTGAGRTWNEKKPSDAGDPGAPGAGLSDSNGPSDPDAKRRR